MLGTRKTITIGDYPVSYIECGDSTAQPILFLHGWGGEALSFQLLFESLHLKGLTAHYVALDLPGFGQSPPPPHAWSLSDYVTFTQQFVEQMHMRPLAIVAHSFGGRIVTKLLSIDPDIASQVVYIAPAGILRDSSKKQLFSTLSKMFKPLMLLLERLPFGPLFRRLCYRLIGSPDYASLDGVMKDTFKQVLSEDLTPLLHTISTPGLLFWGTHDSYVPVGDAEIMKRAMPQLQVHIFEDARHGIHKTHAALIADEMKKLFP